MPSDALQKIETWFDTHDDGEFARYPRGAAFKVVSPLTTPGVVVIATKQHAVLNAIDEGRWGAEFGVIARYGLPNSADADWIRSFVAPHKVLFLGDMDPPDLMIYAWFREQLHPQPVQHLGVSDRYLESLKVDLPDSFRISLSESEKASLPLLIEVLPNLRDIVGPQCAAILEMGLKIEVEATVSAKRSNAFVLKPAFDD